jgi:molybdenum-dependent DNA-binding transcriptional regulator ModE
MPAATQAIDEHLKTWATERQAQYIEAVNRLGSMRAAAAEFGVNHTSISNSLADLKRLAARKGYSPGEDARGQAAEGFNVRGKSTMYDRDGKVVAQWVKTTADAEAREQMLRDFAATLAEEVKGLAPLTAPPEHSDEDLLCVYPMGDPHFGMYAWAKEAGDDFDLSIAERLTFAAVDRLVSSAPPAGTALLLNLGDMFHADNQKNQSQSGHQLDVDGRWAKVQQVGLLSMLHCAKRLLERHKRVILRFNKGNHDGHSSQALALMVACYFNNEPRIEVDLSPAVMWYFRFDRVLIASTHGDTIKGQDMVPVMAADRPEDWGATAHRYVYVGHVHHSDLKEYRGGVVEYFRTLAARDAWHAGQGYRAGRDMRLIVHHRDHGEIERHRCDVGMLEKQ